MPSQTSRGSDPERSPFGRVVLITGPEGLLAERAVARVVAQARAVDAGSEVTRIGAERLDLGRLLELTGESLFATRRVVVVEDLAEAPADCTAELTGLARTPAPDLALVLVHAGQNKGRALLDAVKSAKVEVIECPTPKTWDLPSFVAAEVRGAGGSIDAGTASALVDAVGHDLRTVAAAVSQLVADSPDGQVTATQIKRYFGGRAEVTSFAVADAVLAGRPGPALEQLRWALATGVAPVLVTSALATGLRGLGKLLGAASGLREAELAKEVGVPPWKLKSMRAQARGWDAAGLAAALRIVAHADADIKGAADDAEFALERAVLAVARSRRG